MDIVSGLAAAKATLDLVRALRELDQDLSAAELKANMAELYGNLADVRMALVDAQTEIAEKNKEIALLLEKFKGGEALVEHNGYKYKAAANGKPIGLPFCPNCLSQDGTQIHPAHLLARSFQCPRCKALYSNLTTWNG